jgi:hypothetical protein
MAPFAVVKSVMLQVDSFVDCRKGACASRRWSAGRPCTRAQEIRTFAQLVDNLIHILEVQHCILHAFYFISDLFEVL